MPKKLAIGLTQLSELEIDPFSVQTNIVSPTIVKNKLNIDSLLLDLDKFYIKVKKIDQNRFRMVTHYQISDKDIDYVVDSFKKILSA